MKLTTINTKFVFERASRTLTALSLLAVTAFYVPAASAQTPGPGSILSATGVSFGGIVEFNSNATNFVHLSGNTIDNGCTTEIQHKSEHPSASRDGRLIAFSSNRNRTGAVGASESSFRIFVMNGDGSGVPGQGFNVQARSGSRMPRQGLGPSLYVISLEVIVCDRSTGAQSTRITNLARRLRYRFY